MAQRHRSPYNWNRPPLRSAHGAIRRRRLACLSRCDPFHVSGPARVAPFRLRERPPAGRPLPCVCRVPVSLAGAILVRGRVAGVLRGAVHLCAGHCLPTSNVGPSHDQPRCQDLPYAAARAGARAGPCRLQVNRSAQRRWRLQARRRQQGRRRSLARRLRQGRQTDRPRVLRLQPRKHRVPALAVGSGQTAGPSRGRLLPEGSLPRRRLPLSGRHHLQLSPLAQVGRRRGQAGTGAHQRLDGAAPHRVRGR